MEKKVKQDKKEKLKKQALSSCSASTSSDEGDDGSSQRGSPPTQDGHNESSETKIKMSNRAAKVP